MSEENSSANVTTPFGGFSFSGKRMAEFIAVASLLVMGITAYALWQHSADAKETGKALAAELQRNRDRNIDSDQKIQEAIKEQTRATKLQTCIMYLNLSDEQKKKLGLTDRVEICR